MRAKQKAMKTKGQICRRTMRNNNEIHVAYHSEEEEEREREKERYREFSYNKTERKQAKAEDEGEKQRKISSIVFYQRYNM